MPESQFPVPVEQITGTLIELLKAQGDDRLVKLIQGSDSALVSLGMSNYDDTHEEWRLRISVPVARYASVEAQVDNIEKELTRKVSPIGRNIDGHWITEVNLLPQLVVPIAAITPPPADAEIERIFGKDCFRLFISHKTKDKVFLSGLKIALSYFGVSAFLAHEDIAPTMEWQHEIELALRSMQAMVTYLTTDFGVSDWTDQEVGWAMGRGVFVIPIKVDINPYGFMGKIHAVHGYSLEASALADKIVAQLVKHPQTGDALRGPIVNQLAQARSFRSAQQFQGLLAHAKGFTEKEKQTLLESAEQNNQVRGAHGVLEWIRGTFGEPQPARADDDLPF